MISFKASYIDSANIKRITPENQLRDYKVSFVELNPCSKNDIQALGKVNRLWENRNSFADNILHDIIEYPVNRNFYALTVQKNNFENLLPEDILALSEISQEEEAGIKLEYLQVDPENNMQAFEPQFKKIGTAIINSIKKLFPSRDITVDIVPSAWQFYESNGFKYIARDKCIFKR